MRAPRDARPSLAGPLAACVALAAHPAAGLAQEAEPGWPLRDNSYFLEEAFNQEEGIFQNILRVIRWEDDPQGAWEARFEQEWPIGGQLHQLSYTIPLRWNELDGLDDIAVNYRYQALAETERRPAFAPRLSILLPAAREDLEDGTGETGWEVDLPFSKAVGDVYLHLNAGARFRPDVGTPGGGEVGLETPFLGASAILRVRPRLDLMLETLAESEESVVGPDATGRGTRWLLSPGFRAGWRLGGGAILVAGAAAPIGLTDTTEEWGVLAYLSYEAPFR